MAKANSSKLRDFLQILRHAVKRGETRAEGEQDFEKFIEDTATDRRGPDQKKKPNNQMGEEAENE